MADVVLEVQRGSRWVKLVAFPSCGFCRSGPVAASGVDVAYAQDGPFALRSFPTQFAVGIHLVCQIYNHVSFYISLCRLFRRGAFGQYGAQCPSGLAFPILFACGGKQPDRRDVHVVPVVDQYTVVLAVGLFGKRQ